MIKAKGKVQQHDEADDQRECHSECQRLLRRQGGKRVTDIYKGRTEKQHEEADGQRQRRGKCQRLSARKGRGVAKAAILAYPQRWEGAS